MKKVKKLAILWLLLFLSTGGLLPALHGNGQQTLSAGQSHTLVIGENNTLWAWGGNSLGQLGNNATIDKLQPTRIGADFDWRYVSAGENHSAAIATDGTLWTWGANEFGQLGTGSTESSLVPVQVGSFSDWTHVSTGSSFTVGIRNSGKLFVWGSNSLGQLARNRTEITQSTEPLPVDEDQFYTAISAGVGHVLAIRTSGVLQAWGNNGSAQLGLGISPGLPIITVTQVGTSSDWSRISAANSSSFAINASGSLFAWGFSGAPQLGQGKDVFSSLIPTQVGAESNWNRVDGSSTHALALKTDGTLWGWGSNGSIQLGLPIFDASQQPIFENHIRDEPVQLGSLSNWSAIAAGDSFSALADGNGVVFSSGTNDQGQLGNNTILATPLDTDGFSGSFFGIPDITIDTILVNPDNPSPGGIVNVNIFLVNAGTKTIPENSGIQIELRFSEDNVFDSGDIALAPPGGGPIVASGAIGGSLGLTVDTQVVLPNPIDAGTFFIVGRADTTEAVNETEEENNDGTIAEALEFRPDLTIAVANLDLSGVPFLGGDTLNFDIQVSNSGNGRLVAGEEGDFDVRLLLSENGVPDDTGDIVLEDNFNIADGVNAGATVTRSVTLDLPRALPVGNYRIIAQVDVNDDINEITEGGEDNNVFIPPTSEIEVTGIDLVEALDNPDLDGPIQFTTGGDNSWFGQSTFIYTGVDAPVGNDDAAESPPLESGETAFFEATVPGPSRISFFWQANTSSPDNFLSFSVDGAEQEDGRIFGDNPFERVIFTLPAEINKVRWTYSQGTPFNDAAADTGWVDGVELVALEGKDIVMVSTSFTPGILVPLQNRLPVTVLGSNQGQVVMEDFEVTVTLSLDRDPNTLDGDVVLGTLERFPELDADDRFGYFASLEIGANVPAGNYFLIVQLDSGNIIDEINEENNFFIAASPDLTVEPRPDIIPLTLDFNPRFPIPPLEPDPTVPVDPDPYFFIFGEKLELDFQIINIGLADVPTNPDTGQPTPFNLDVVLSSDINFGSADDFTIVSISETLGLPVGQSRNYHVTVEIQPDTPTGERFFLGVVVDSSFDVTEIQEINNAIGSTDTQEIMFSEIPIAEAVDDNAGRIYRNERLDNADQNYPWFGQTDEAFIQQAGHDAVQSSDIDNGDTATFEVDFTTVGDQPEVISFAWKVSSERSIIVDGEGDVVKFDALTFFIDEVEQDFISGEVDWEEKSFTLQPGAHVLRWVYSKDGSVSQGQDAGWVDFVRTTSPDLLATNIDVSPILAEGEFLTAGAPFEVDVSITNQGVSDVPTSPPFRVQIRISTDQQFDDEGDVVRNDFILDTFETDDGLPAGETVVFNRQLNVPINIALPNEYFVGVLVDVLGDIAESDETNNELFTSSSLLSIQPTIDLASALNAPGFDSPNGWQTTGDSTWFGQNGKFVPIDGSNSSAQSSPLLVGQQANVRTSVDGPAIVSFYWKVSSTESFNFLSFGIGDIEQERISGDIDWTFTSGTFSISHLGVKTSGFPFDVTAEEMNGVLNEFNSVGSGVTVAGDFSSPDGTRTYTVTFNDNGDRGPFKIDPEFLGQPGTFLVIETVKGDASTREVQTISISPRVEFFVSAGFPFIEWSYNKNSVDQEEGIEDSAWVDQVDVVPVTKPDLLVTTLSVVPGEYILDRRDDADRDKLPMTIVAKNRGANVPELTDITPSDITVALSSDRVFGNEDDIPLGIFARVENTSEGLIISFSGDVEFPLNTPTGDYFVVAYIDFLNRFEEYQPNDFERFTDTDNNLLFTPSRSVSVSRRPDLILENVGFDSTKEYFIEGAINLDFNIRNRGLESTVGNVPVIERVRLFEGTAPNFIGIPVNNLVNNAADVEDILGLSVFVKDLTLADGNRLEFFETLQGISELNPSGGILKIETELILPTFGQLSEALSDGGDITSVLEFFNFFLVIDIDFGNLITESDEQNSYVLIKTFQLRVPAPDNFDNWAGRNVIPLGDLVGDPDGDTLTNLQEYALGTNPRVSEATVVGGSNSLLNVPGVILVNGEQFLGLTFEFNAFATDLLYTVEISNNGVNFSPIYFIEPPFLETSILTGPGGIIHDTQVFSLTPLGQAVRITVRDFVPIDEITSRFMRLKIEKIN